MAPAHGHADGGAPPIDGAVAGAGLAGDRYATGTGTYSGTGRGPRDVTLIEREAVDAVRADDGLDLTEAEPGATS